MNFKNSKSDMLTVLWLRCHFSFAYGVNDIGQVTREHFKKLTEGEIQHVRLISEKEIKEIEDQKRPAPPIPEKDYIPVNWKKCHINFAYSVNQVGKVTPDNFVILYHEGYVTPVNDDDVPEEVWKKIRSLTKNI